ncbi:MAG: LuxR family transcriptional regulator [Haliea sp.]|nr:MAG: LuxR family transcriptional regulator [Haliea sp.]
MNLDELQSDLQGFGAATDIGQVEALCRRHGAQMGFESFIYALRIPAHFTDSRVVMIQSYPQAWTSRYLERGYHRIDPVIAHCAGHVTPVAWHRLAPPPHSAAGRFMGEAGEFGLRSGLTVPVHSPHGEMGLLSFATGQASPAAHQATEQATAHAQLLSGYLHEAMRRLLGLSAGSGRAPLTAREQECLRWVADGKSSWETARVLNLSERTVNFHIGRSMEKLDVCNRQHAVARATLLGLLQPRPF